MLQVSFYSYKGGAGRSTTSWNTIQRLVENPLIKPTIKEPFVIVDTDTESAGSTFLYRAEDIFLRNRMKPSIQKRIKGGENEYCDYSDASEEEKREFFMDMHPIGTYFGLPEEQDEAVLFIGADLDKSSKEDMPDIDKDKKNGGWMIKNFNNITRACKHCGAKALFFDTPSGTQNLARLSIQESKIIVCCMRPTNQFREGTKRQLINFISDQKIAGKRKYILTPTVICADPGQRFTFSGKKQDYPQKAKEDIEIAFGTEKMQENDNFKQAFKDNVILDMLEPTPDNIKEYPGSESEDNDTVFGIPEIKRFKWFETCLGRLSEDELTPNDKMAVRRYEYLARTILKYSGINI
jgi:hypothetical protein